MPYCKAFTIIENYLCGMQVEYDLAQIQVAVEALAPYLKNGQVIAFHGEMGAGKTTLITAICQHLQVVDTVSSPTFSLINEYLTATGDTVVHMDLYRLTHPQEAVVAGVEDAFYSGNLCLVEWPENAGKLLPDHTLHCRIAILGANTRALHISA